MRLIGEVMEFGRFRSAPAFMKFMGLTPSEYWSGNKVRRGEITKSGNSHIRHVLVEAVQRAHSSVQPGKFVLRRWQGESGPLRQISVTARSGRITSSGCWPDVACSPARFALLWHGNWRGSSGR